MDAISYSHDAYGGVKEDYVSNHRATDISDWKEFAKMNMNETMFKYSITLLDNIECIMVSNSKEKQDVLEVFRKHGIHILPDGRKVEEIVLCKPQ